MPKGIIRSTKSYLKNLVHHTGRVLARQETMSEALARIREDSRKLKQSMLARSESSESRGRAVRLVQEGQKRYNTKQYDAAEKLFRNAIVEDPEYGFAHVYLGHTLYKKGYMKEALASWQRAHDIDPSSEAGLKAMKMIRRTERKRDNVVEALIERTRR